MSPSKKKTKEMLLYIPTHLIAVVVVVVVVGTFYQTQSITKIYNQNTKTEFTSEVKKLMNNLHCVCAMFTNNTLAGKPFMELRKFINYMKQEK